MQNTFIPTLRVFDDLFAPAATRPELPVDVWQAEDSLVVETELPGATEDQLQVEVHGDLLLLKVELPKPAHEGQVLRHERRHGTFERTLKLPYEVAADEVTASLRHGVLTVRLPRTAAERSRRVPVEVA